MPAISEKIVEALPAPAEGNRLHYFSGAICQGKKAPNGFAVRTTAAGTKSFVLFHRVAGKPYLPTLGRWVGNEGGGTLTVRDAIIAASDLAKAMATGKQQDPRPARTRKQQDGDADKGMTVAGLLDTFVARYVRKEAKLRTADEIAKTLDRLVKPAIGKLGIYEIKRAHVSKMLAAIADESGPAMADRVLAHVRKAFSWYAVNGHDDDFKSPVVRGMGPGHGDPRDRVLSDDEFRDIFTALETADVPAAFPAFVKMLLLTATRRNEAAKMSTGRDRRRRLDHPGRSLQAVAETCRARSCHSVVRCCARPDRREARRRRQGLVYLLDRRRHDRIPRLLESQDRTGQDDCEPCASERVARPCRTFGSMICAVPRVR